MPLSARRLASCSSRFRTGALVLFVLWAAPVHGARDVGPQRECATCHIMWLKDFNRQDVVPLIAYEPKPVTESGREDVASTERMCFSCHDGFMLDSRAVWQNPQHSHPVGMKPSEKMRIPTSGGKIVFPLNDDGKVYCGTCHTAHGVDWNQTESPVFLRVKNVGSSLCLACHLDRGTGPAEGNHPVFHSMASPPPGLKAAGAKFGRQGDVICQTCHRVHGAAGKKMLVEANTDSRLCTACHTDQQAILNTKHDLSVMAPDARNRRGETIAESGPCGACHAPHGGNGPALWAREALPSANPAAANCLSCHRSDGLAKEKGVGEHSHPVNVSVTDIGITATPQGWRSRFPLLEKDRPLAPLPLYNSKGLRDPAGDRVACGSCHDPHRWTPAKDAVAPADPRQIEGGPRDSFLRMALDDNSSLCVNCHVGQRPVAASKHNMPAFMAAVGGQKPETKETGVCQSCHQVHHAKGAYLWARAEGASRTGIAPLCASCHRQDGVAAKKLTGAHSHPVDIGLKSGMQPKLPLFASTGSVPGARDKLDCATCHDPHQWNPTDAASKAGADTKIRGDARTSFLRLPAAPDGDLCVECHHEQRFVRRSDHDLSVTAPAAANARGETALQSGVCGQCHAVHNAEETRQLWARAMGQGPNAATQECASCHAAGRPAAAKAPAETQHPPQALVWASAVRARFFSGVSMDLPVFDDKGRSEQRGAITCLTCHDPHRWDPRAAHEGPGKNTEGDVRTSFLRTSNSEHFVCADCHGKDALFRYKYFHGKTSRKSYPLFR
ncbi:MAG: cytochrome c3 family protein [Pseudomonadota bacterium]